MLLGRLSWTPLEILQQAKFSYLIETHFLIILLDQRLTNIFPYFTFFTHHNIELTQDSRPNLEMCYLSLIIDQERDMSSITITFGDQAQNHKGMQIIGKMADKGYSVKDLQQAKKKFDNKGYKCQLISLNSFIQVEATQAKILVVKKGADCLLEGSNANGRDLFEELVKLQWDSKAFMYGRVVSKHARHNLCFDEESQEPDYESGKGRVVPWKDAALLKELRGNLSTYLPDGSELAAEGNYYYDVNKCGIGFHGDAERKRVIAIRLCSGKCQPLHYQWFKNGKPIGKRAIVQLEDRDLYVMSEKTVGTDWKKKLIPTLRHATGIEKYTTI